MERKKTPRRSRAKRPTSGKVVVQHAQRKGEGIQVKMDEKEEQARLEAASALSSLMFLPPLHQQQPLDGQGSGAKPSTPTMTYITTSGTSSGKSKREAPSSGSVGKGRGSAGVTDSKQMGPALSFRVSGNKDVNDKRDKSVLTKLRQQLQTVPKSHNRTDLVNIPQLEFLTTSSEKVLSNSLQRPDSSQQASRPGIPDPHGSIVSVVQQKIVSTADVPLAHVSGTAIMKQPQEVGLALAQLPLLFRANPTVRMPPNGLVSKTYKQESRIDSSSPKVVAASSVHPGAVIGQKLNSDSIDVTFVLKSTSTDMQKADTCDTKLPLKKRKVIGVNDSKAQPNKLVMAPLTIAATSTVASSNVATTTAATTSNISNHLQRQLLDNLKASEISSLLFSNSKIQTSMISNSGSTFEVNSTVSSIKEEDRKTFSPVDPRTSLMVLSEVKVALTPDEDGDLPLHIAAVQENVQMAKHFIQLMSMSSKSVDRYNKAQQTPLHLAVMVNEVDIVSLLMEAGSNPNLMDRQGFTAVHLAVKLQHLHCLQIFLTQFLSKCDLNLRNYEGYSPLHTAVKKRNMKMANMLIQADADINSVDGKSGRSVLFHAVDLNDQDMVRFLLENRANVDQANYAGVTPQMSAQALSHTHICSLLGRVESSLKNFDENSNSQTKKMAIPRIPSKASLCVVDSNVRPPSTRPVSADGSHPVVQTPSSSSSPIDLSFNRSSGQHKATSVEIKKESRVRENHCQLVAALESKMETAATSQCHVIKQEPVDVESQSSKVAVCQEEAVTNSYASHILLPAMPPSLSNGGGDCVMQIGAVNSTCQTDLSGVSYCIVQARDQTAFEQNQAVPRTRANSDTDSCCSDSELVAMATPEFTGMESSDRDDSVQSETDRQTITMVTVTDKEMTSYAISEGQAVAMDTFSGRQDVTLETVSESGAGSLDVALDESEEPDLVIDESGFLDDNSQTQENSSEEDETSNQDYGQAAVAMETGDGNGYSRSTDGQELSPTSSRADVLAEETVTSTESVDTFTDQGSSVPPLDNIDRLDTPQQTLILSEGGDTTERLHCVQGTETAEGPNDKQITLYFKEGDSFHPVVLNNSMLDKLKLTNTAFTCTSPQSPTQAAMAGVQEIGQGQSQVQGQGENHSNSVVISNNKTVFPVMQEVVEDAPAMSVHGTAIGSIVSVIKSPATAKLDHKLDHSTTVSTRDEVTRKKSAGTALGKNNTTAIQKTTAQGSFVITRETDTVGGQKVFAPCVSLSTIQSNSAASCSHADQSQSQSEKVAVSKSRGVKKDKRAGLLSFGQSEEGPQRKHRKLTMDVSVQSETDIASGQRTPDIEGGDKGDSQVTVNLGKAGNRVKKKMTTEASHVSTEGDITVPSLTLISFPQTSRQVPVGSQSAPSRGTVNPCHRLPTGSSEGTLTRVSANIKNRLSRALMSPQRNNNNQPRHLSFQEGDRRFPKLEVQSQPQK